MKLTPLMKQKIRKYLKETHYDYKTEGLIVVKMEIYHAKKCFAQGDKRQMKHF